MMNDKALSQGLDNIFSAQVRAFGCLFDTGNRNSEKPDHKELRLERVSFVRSLCSGIKIDNLANRGVRNALAHFDERFLKALIDYPECARVEWISFSHKDAISAENGKLLLIGVYFFDVDELHLFDEMIKLREMRTEVEAVLKVLTVQED